MVLLTTRFTKRSTGAEPSLKKSIHGRPTLRTVSDLTGRGRGISRRKLKFSAAGSRGTAIRHPTEVHHVRLGTNGRPRRTTKRRYRMYSVVHSVPSLCAKSSPVTVSQVLFLIHSSPSYSNKKIVRFQRQYAIRATSSRIFQGPLCIRRSVPTI